MSLPTIMGTYIGQPTEWSISEATGGSRTVTFVCHFNLNTHLDRGNQVSVDHDITGYFHVIKKDGQPNQFTIDALKESLGWDGRSIQSLIDGEWSNTQVQLVIDKETDLNGKLKTKVQFINPLGGRGSAIEKADPQAVKSLDAKYGAMLRALNPATPGKAPAAKPAAPATPSDPTAAAKQKAWNAFLAKWNDYAKENPAEGTKEKRDEQWRGLMADIFPKRDPKTATAAEWDNAASLIDADYSAAVGTLIPI